jgi:hypothetical protein
MPRTKAGWVKLHSNVLQEELTPEQFTFLIKSMLLANPSDGQRGLVDMSIRDLAGAMKMTRSRIHRLMQPLLARGIIKKQDKGFIVMVYDLFQGIVSQERDSLPPQVSHQRDKVSHQRDSLSHQRDKVSHQRDSSLVGKDGEEDKEDKEEKKDMSVKKDIIEIFNFWNEQKIVVHRRLTDEIRRAITAKRREYSQEELCKAITNYAEIVLSPDYWWNHRWTLKDFLSRGVERFMDGDVAKQNFKGRRDNAEKRQLPGRYEKPGEFFAKGRGAAEELQPKP